MPALQADHQSLTAFLKEWVLECYKLQVSTFDDNDMVAWATKLWPSGEV